MAKQQPKKRAKPATKTKTLKTATPGKAAMSKPVELTHAEVSILGRMADLEPETARYRVLESALAFKSSWVVLGEHLADVVKTSAFKAWGYASFERYCSDELFVSTATAKKLVRSWQWIGDEAPEYLPPKSTVDLVARKQQAALPTGDLPDLKSITVLADAKKALKEARVSEDAYLALKRAALDGESASALKRALNESIPAEAKPKAADDKVRHLRRASKACAAVIDALREWDSGGEAAGDDLLVLAEQLSKAIHLRLPRAD
ncbi:MAG: hypothetical protein FJ137_08385 [Deltaproteobacteria bacterium]|nr:hypothetical protein [Deltaproteobacteria bacterium]